MSALVAVLALSPRIIALPYWEHAFAVGPRVDAAGMAVDVGFGSRVAVGASGSIFVPWTGYASASVASPSAERAWEALFDAKYTFLARDSWELYAIGGVGAVGTRPVSVVDPAHRSFSFRPALATAVGVGGHVLLGAAATLVLEMRETTFVENLESTRIAEPDDPNAWYGDRRFVAMLTARIGLAMTWDER